MIRLCRLREKNTLRDWIDFRDAHTNYEWAVQEAANIVEPFGEERADMRMAMNTMQIVASLNPQMSDETFQEVFRLLRNYTGDDDQNDQGELEANPKALAAIKVEE